MSLKTYLNPETIGNNTIDKRHLNIEDMMVSTTSPGMMSAEDKRNLDNFTVKTIIWDNATDLSNMNDFVNVGVYDIKGERTRSDDNLPILNTGGGNTFNARLIVLDSSISGTGKDDDKCITQIITFNNRLGQGEVYIRTGKGKTLDNLTWDNWSTLQRNVNVVQVNSLDGLVDNGIYSGVLTPTGETFVLVVINNYAIAQQFGLQKSISQFKYSVDTYGNVYFGKRVKVGDGSFPSEWETINIREINKIMDEYYRGLTEYVSNDICKIDIVQKPADSELIIEKKDGSKESKIIECATRHFSGFMSPSDKKKLDIMGIEGDSYDLNTYVNEGVYIIETKNNEAINYPIQTTKHSSLRLSVLKSYNGDSDGEFVIVQVLNINNHAGGEGGIYIRSCQNDIWKPWSKLQTNMEVGLINQQQMDGLIDNGIYSGILQSTGETFVIICINNYAIAQQVGIKHISQLKYSLVVGTGEIKIQKRTRDAYGFWTEWCDINDTPEIVNDCNGSSFVMDIYPNKYYKFDNVSNLTVNFNQGQNGILKNYMFEVSFSGGNTLNLPDGIKWANGNAPIFVAGNTYQISVINNLGVFTEFY